MKEERSLAANADATSSGLTEIVVEVRDDQILAMEAIMTGEWQSKNSCTPSAIVQEALDMFIKTRIVSCGKTSSLPADEVKKISDSCRS